MRLLDLFSGIGGFSLAASWTWGKDLDIVGFCENDPFCQKKLSELFPGVPIYHEIKKFKGNQFGTINIVTGGEPCQPHSLAGKRKGKKDDRYLWPEMFRVIQEAKPNWVINENVVGSVSNGIVDCKCDDLESEGYACQAYNIPAIAVGAPHIRQRIWIVAYNESKSNGKHYTEKSNGQIQQFGNSFKPAKIPNPNKAGLQGSNTERDIRTNKCLAELCESVANTQGERFGRRKMQTDTGNKSENKQGGNKGWGEIEQYLRQWTIEPELGRVANGIPNRVDRLKGLGNAIVPQVATVIMQAIKETDK